MTEIQQIKAKLEELRGLCGDHSCMFGSPRGMATNALCRCELRNPRVRYGVQLLKRLIKLYEEEKCSTTKK